jgi:uncharacterized protein (UPF0147 family)
MAGNELASVISALEELCDDNTVPRNIKVKLQELTTLLKDPSKSAMTINKALHDLDEINDDINLPSYIRTQIWNVVSMLEKLA